VLSHWLLPSLGLPGDTVSEGIVHR
jgi:hypothetical protein